MGTVFGRLRRMFVPEEELEAEELHEQSVGCGAQSISDCQPRQKVTIRGTVTSITSDAQNRWLEAEISDGTGSVRLIWMGRSRLECLLPGSNVLVKGRLALERRKPVIYNPEFEIV